ASLATGLYTGINLSGIGLPHKGILFSCCWGNAYPGKPGERNRQPGERPYEGSGGCATWGCRDGAYRRRYRYPLLDRLPGTGLDHPAVRGAARRVHGDVVVGRLRQALAVEDTGLTHPLGVL